MGTFFKEGNVVVLSQSTYQTDLAMRKICIFLHDDKDDVYVVQGALSQSGQWKY